MDLDNMEVHIDESPVALTVRAVAPKRLKPLNYLSVRSFILANETSTSGGSGYTTTATITLDVKLRNDEKE